MTDATTYQFTQWFSGTVFESYSPLLAHFFTPVYVPSVSPEAATYIGLGVYVSTCFTLNLIAKGIFGIKGEKNPQNKLPEALQKIGIDLPPPPLNKIPEDRIEITPIQLEVAPIKKEESPQSEQENFNHIASPPIEEPKRYSLKNHPGFAPTMNAINPPNNEQNVTLPLEDSFADSEEESATKKGFCSFNFCFKK
jgi:hypothetical protein